VLSQQALQGLLQGAEELVQPLGRLGVQVPHVMHALMGAIEDAEAARYERDDRLSGVALAQQGEEQRVVLIRPAQVHHDDGGRSGGQGLQGGIGVLGRGHAELRLSQEAQEQLAGGTVWADDEDAAHGLAESLSILAGESPGSAWVYSGSNPIGSSARAENGLLNRLCG
jgi:hypothetical protein